MADAYARKTKTPIDITDFSTIMRGLPAGSSLSGADEMFRPGEVAGEYDPNSDQIQLRIPPQGAAPASLLDTLKHELVHQALRGSTLPNVSQYSGFSGAAPNAWSSVSGLLGNLGALGQEQPGPDNLWNWNKANRVGSFASELPAYMSVFKQGQLPGVTQNQRDSYMSQFYAYMKSIGKGDVADRIATLLSGRQAYDKTGLLPEAK